MKETVELSIMITQEHQSRGLGDEEGVIEQDDEGHHLGLRELGGDPGLRAADRAVSGGDRHLAAREPPRAQDEDHREEEEQRTAEGVLELDAEGSGEAAKAHDVVPASVDAEANAASAPPAGGTCETPRRPRAGRAPRRMSTR